MMNLYRRIAYSLSLWLLLVQPLTAAPMPKGAQPVSEPCLFHDFRLHLELSEASAGAIHQLAE